MTTHQPVGYIREAGDDDLLVFLVTHSPCIAASTRALTLGPLEIDPASGGVRHDARCRRCRAVVTLRAVPYSDQEPTALWRARLQAAALRTYPDLFGAPGTPLPAYQRFYDRMLRAWQAAIDAQTGERRQRRRPTGRSIH